MIAFIDTFADRTYKTLTLPLTLTLNLKPTTTRSTPVYGVYRGRNRSPWRGMFEHNVYLVFLRPARPELGKVLRIQPKLRDVCNMNHIDDFC